MENNKNIFLPSSTRRGFLQGAAMLSLSTPVIEASMAAMDDHQTPPTIPKGAMPYKRFDPALPPPPENGVLNLHWKSYDQNIHISDGVIVAGWTFEGDIPGPIAHCCVGDTVNITLTNESSMKHSIDFHAAQINPATAFRDIEKGQSVSFSFKPRYAGAFMYHCATPPALMHIGAGMFGALIVSPQKPLPKAKEFVLVQNEYYLGQKIDGVYVNDVSKMVAVTPDLLSFNGRPHQYSQEPIHVKVGDRVRFWVVAAGPSLPCYFHVIGEQFDKVYLGAPPNNAIEGVQTSTVPPGGGMCFELVCDVPGTFVFMNHAMAYCEKGAMGKLVVEK